MPKKRSGSLFLLLVKLSHIIIGGAFLMSLCTPYINPTHLPWLPFLGLGFPVLLFLNIVFGLFWLVKRSAWFWAALLTVVISIPFQMKIFSLNIMTTDIPQHNKSQFKLMSYNVRLFDVYNPKAREALNTRNSIFSYLRKENADILCLQEYYQQEKPTFFEISDSIMQIMKGPWFHKKGIKLNKSRQTFGLAIFSKLPIIHKGSVQHKGRNENNKNYCIYADVVKKQDTIRIYNVHLQSIKLKTDYQTKHMTEGNKEETTAGIKRAYAKLKKAFTIRAAQSSAVSDHMMNSPYPVIVCGDFNDTPMSYTYHRFEKKLTDAFRNTSNGFGATYVGLLPAGRIDYIFHSNELNSSNFNIQKNPLSDHRAISCVIY